MIGEFSTVLSTVWASSSKVSNRFLNLVWSIFFRAEYLSISSSSWASLLLSWSSLLRMISFCYSILDCLSITCWSSWVTSGYWLMMPEKRTANKHNTNTPAQANTIITLLDVLLLFLKVYRISCSSGDSSFFKWSNYIWEKLLSKNGTPPLKRTPQRFKIIIYEDQLRNHPGMSLVHQPTLWALARHAM